MQNVNPAPRPKPRTSMVRDKSRTNLVRDKGRGFLEYEISNVPPLNHCSKEQGTTRCGVNFTPATLRKFTIQMFIALFVLGTVLFLRPRDSYILFYYLGGAIFLLGTCVPNSIKPIYFICLKLAFILEWVSTRFIMLVIFYLVLTPFGLAMRLLGRDCLDRKIEKNKESYWKEKVKHPFNPQDYERQF
jgi:hypothetical protein